jgi:hypothetical protein
METHRIPQVFDQMKTEIETQMKLIHQTITPSEKITDSLTMVIKEQLSVLEQAAQKFSYVPQLINLNVGGKLFAGETRSLFHFSFTIINSGVCNFVQR